MANVSWTTSAGSLGVINEGSVYSKQLDANSLDGASLTYSKIAGTLPPGITLTSTGLLQGTPSEVATRSLFTFVVRASDGTNIADRTFSLQIQGADAPVFDTASGQLDLSDSTRVGNKWVLDGSYIEYQIQATDTDTAEGQTLVYDIKSGTLPPGVSMSTTGLISGVVLLADDERFAPRGGYASEDFPNWYDDDPNPLPNASPTQPQNIYDRTVRSISTWKNYEFIVRVSDGTSVVEQANSIFVFTADFWRVDNDSIIVWEGSTLPNFPDITVTMDASSNRRPVFQTASNLGTFRHDNNVVIKIDVVDFDPLQADLQYSIVSGALPTGLSIDINTGEIAGTLPTQAAVETDYTFTVRASRTPYAGATVYEDRVFTMTVIGAIDVGIAFTTSASLGTVTAGIPSLLSITAEAAETNRVLSYSVTAGSLPTGLSLSEQGNIIGTIDLSDFDTGEFTLNTSTGAYTKNLTFTVTVSDQYQSAASSREFTITVNLPYGVEYGNLSAQGLVASTDRNLFYQIAQDPNINNDTNIFRPEDPAFGIEQNPEMLLIAGLEHKTATILQNQMSQNHTPKTLYFGDIKTAVAKQNGNTMYEVVYIEMKDDLVNNSGTAVSASIDLSTSIYRPMNGTSADGTRITSDYLVYEVTTDGGLSFSISGSKIRYANELTADLGTFEKLFPNAVANMRSRMKSLGQREYLHLPLWMRTSQDGSGVPLGYKMAIVLAYCKPGQSSLVRRRILNKNINFKNIQFIIDRYRTNINLVDTGTITPDGSTTTFEINEIVHEEELRIKENSTILRYGQQVTADNYERPDYLSADTLLRSADYEPQFRLTHDTTNKKTTINFTNAPASNSNIRVERRGDKYLGFQKKLKE
jgi:hypothetical protein